jgi:predicted transcriptional regulator of viral defense system
MRGTDEIDESVDMQQFRRVRDENAIADLAERQYGVIAREQLAALGIGPGAIAYRMRLGRLHRLHRGVYAVGQRELPREARWVAAVLACGPGAALSHRAGGAHWQLIRDRGWCEVTVPVERRSRRGITVYQAALPPDEITVHRGITVTTVPRTLFDLAAVLSARQLERAINEAEVLRLWDGLSLDQLLERYPRRRGNRAVRAALDGRRAGLTVTKSDLEEMFVALIDSAGIPRPEINAIVEGLEVDAVFRAARLAVELDSREYHDTPSAFERDRERDRTLHVAGWRPIRITHRQLRESPHRVVADVRSLLAGDGRLAA